MQSLQYQVVSSGTGGMSSRCTVGAICFAGWLHLSRENIFLLLLSGAVSACKYNGNFLVQRFKNQNFGRFCCRSLRAQSWALQHEQYKCTHGPTWRRSPLHQQNSKCRGEEIHLLPCTLTWGKKQQPTSSRGLDAAGCSVSQSSQLWTAPQLPLGKWFTMLFV